MEVEQCMCISEADQEVAMEVCTETDSRTLANTLAHVVSQRTKEEKEYLAEQNIHKQEISSSALTTLM